MRYFLIGVLITWIIIIGFIIKGDREAAGIGAAQLGQDKVQIVFWHAMGGPLGRVMTNLIDRYNGSQNRYFIKAVGMGSYDTLAKKILASLVAKEAPDIAQNYETLTKKFIKHHKIVCLDDLIASEAENIKDDIIPIMLENNTFDGKLYSFPFNKSVPVLYYNKDMFKKVGLDPDKPPTTLTELAEYSRKISMYHQTTPGEDPTIYGYGNSKANVWGFLNRIIQFGGKIVNDENNKSYFDHEASINALLALQVMLFENTAKEGQGFDHQNDFIAGKCGIIESSIVSKVYMEGSINFDFGVAPLPGEVQKGAILSGTNINIFDNGDPQKVAGAWDFIKWFTSTEISAEWSIRTTYMPVRKSSLSSDYFVKAQERDPNLKAPYVQLDYCSFEPRLTCWFEVRDLLADHLERASIEIKNEAEVFTQTQQPLWQFKGEFDTASYLKEKVKKHCEEIAKDVNAILRHSTN